MSYESAPSTALVATHCAACGRPLRDAVSVELGMGPECREKLGLTGMEPECPDTSRAVRLLASAGVHASGDARALANAAVHWAAVWQRDARVAVLASAVEALGYTRLADRLRERAEGAKVTVELNETGASYHVHAPYSEEFNRLRREIPRARWSPELKAHVVPRFCRRMLWDALCKAFPGAVITGPNGTAAATVAA